MLQFVQFRQGLDSIIILMFCGFSYNLRSLNVKRVPRNGWVDLWIDSLNYWLVNKMQWAMKFKCLPHLNIEKLLFAVSMKRKCSSLFALSFKVKGSIHGWALRACYARLKEKMHFMNCSVSCDSTNAIRHCVDGESFTGYFSERVT